MLRILASLFTLLALLAGSPWLLPLAKESVKLVAARDDPAALADLGLAGFTADDAARAMEAALAADDAALAASYLALADARGLAIPEALRSRVDVANSALAETMRAAKAFGLGFVTGTPQDLPGLAGAAASDLMVWGDIRDAGREGLKLARGEEADQLILGLSAVGLAITAGTYATGGLGLPARMGISLVKVAKRTGKLSAALARSLTRAVREAVDFTALRRLAAHPGTVDGAALKGVVRSDRVATLSRMLDDTARIEAKAGTRAALEALSVADGGRDLARAARLADAKGVQTLAILKTLGRGALVITGALFHLIWWIFATAAYLLALVSSFNSFCVACARRTWKRPRRRAPLARQEWRVWRTARTAAGGNGCAAPLPPRSASISIPAPPVPPAVAPGGGTPAIPAATGPAAPEGPAGEPAALSAFGAAVATAHRLADGPPALTGASRREQAGP
ncbi:hypothetical protein V5F49_18455 [Xanthobacter sp. V3C-3]|uniref:hypothetical protein n=1 Tax=Xanthobacter lutulentifluminis TaxID=3119935 RepID=UPI0037274C2A